MPFKKSLLLIVSLMFLAGCSTVYGVNVDYDENYDFSKAQKYDWADLKTDSETKREALRMVKSAVDANLKDKGMQLAGSNPDVVLVPYTGVKQKMAEIPEPGPDFRRSWQTSVYYGAPSGFEYEQGKLTLDFVDKKTNQLVWRGVAKADVDRVDTSEKRKHLIDKAVKKIFKDFPPK